MQQATQTVRLSFNIPSLVKQLRNSFTDKTTVLSELTQNARRAGATYVAFEFNEVKDRIYIADNGCGIHDFQTLFSKAESGWDEAVMETDTPYGIGFLSALYAAKNITIESGSQCMSFNTDTALSLEDMVVSASSRRHGTLIMLEGCELDLRDIHAKLKNIAMGFPIDVKFQGESLPRSHALDSSKPFIDCAIGAVHLDQFDDVYDGQSAFHYGTRATVAYLQGVKVFSTRHNLSQDCNIVHLDTKHFKGRAPDRDSLVDAQDAQTRVESEIKSLWQQNIQQFVNVLPPEDISCQFYQALKYWDCLALLNDNPFVPTHVLREMTEYPIHFHDWEDRYSGLASKQSIHRNDIESGHMTVLRDMDYPNEDEPYQHYMYAYTLEALSLIGQLDSGHWLQQHLVVIEPNDITVHLMGPVTEAYFSSAYVDANALLCEAVELDGPLGRVRITDEAFVIDDCWLSSPGYPSLIAARAIGRKWYDKTMVVPRGVVDGRVVRQCCQFMDDSGYFNESDADNDDEAFCQFLLSQRMGSEVSLLRNLLEKAGFKNYACFQDKTFTVSMTASDCGRNQLQVTMS